MIFSRTYRLTSSMKAEDIKGRLLGKHLQVHKLDFEVSEKDRMLKIIPHAEKVTDIKTLPITHIKFKGNGDKTQVFVSSKMRKIDSGGPMLIVIFCFFLVAAGVIAYVSHPQANMAISFTLAGIGLAIFLIFWMRMQTGYFDYIRKIKDFIKKQSVA